MGDVQRRRADRPRGAHRAIHRAAALVHRLLVDNDTGSVTIVGTDTDEISVEAEVSDGLRHTGFRHEVVGSTLELHGSCPVIGSMWCRVTYRIEVPAGLDRRGRHRRRPRRRQQRRRRSCGSTRTTAAIELYRRLRHDRRRRRQRAHHRQRSDRARSSTSTRQRAASSCRSPRPPDTVTASGDNGSIEIVVPEIDIGYDVTADTYNGGEDIDRHQQPRVPAQDHVGDRQRFDHRARRRVAPAASASGARDRRGRRAVG